MVSQSCPSFLTLFNPDGGKLGPKERGVSPLPAKLPDNDSYRPYVFVWLDECLTAHYKTRVELFEKSYWVITCNENREQDSELRNDLGLLRKCDALLILDLVDCEPYITAAIEYHIPVFHTVESLDAWRAK